MDEERLAHLIITWWSSLAKEAKRMARAMVKPPTTAVNRVDFLLQRLNLCNQVSKWTLYPVVCSILTVKTHVFEAEL